MYRLKRHPLAIEAKLKRSIALAYAVPSNRLESLLGPGLELDTFEGYGFLVVALVQSENLRIKGFPQWSGISFFLSGYRLFVRYTSPAGKHLRRLKILRSETDSKFLVATGNLLTHYGYRKVDVKFEEGADFFQIGVFDGGVQNLGLVANFASESLPENSIFGNEKQARSFAGPMPFTFDYERETNSIVSVQGMRSNWSPRLFEARLSIPPDFSKFGLCNSEMTLASAYQVENVQYAWRPGKVEALG